MCMGERDVSEVFVMEIGMGWRGRGGEGGLLSEGPVALTETAERGQIQLRHVMDTTPGMQGDDRDPSHWGRLY